MTAAALSDNLPFYDDPNEVKPCQWCNKPMVRREVKRPISHFRKRKTCSYACHQRLRTGVHSGQKWGHLTVLYEGGTHITPTGTKSNKWVCECICGVKVSVQASHLKNGRAQSCGCRGRITPYQKFGMLKTIKKDSPQKRPDGAKVARWVCQCDCGVVITALASNLLKGDTASCGCKTTTRLEDAVERSLNRLDVPYKKEYKPKPLVDRGFQYCLDFYLPNHNLNIEADGKDFHGGGHKYKSPEEQIEHDDNRNRRVSWFFGCYILRLSEDLLDGNPKHLDAKLRRFLDDMVEKPQYWLTYDFKTPC